MSESDSQENEETESGELNSEHESSEHQSEDPQETTAHEEEKHGHIEDRKVEETTRDDTTKDEGEETSSEEETIGEDHGHGEEQVHKQEEEEKIHQEKVLKQEAEENVHQEKVLKGEAEEKVHHVDGGEITHKHEAEEKVHQVGLEGVHKQEAHQADLGENIHKEKAEEKVHQEKAHKQEAEEKVHQVDIEGEKVHKGESEVKAHQVDIEGVKVHKGEAEEKAHQVDIEGEKVHKGEAEEKVHQVDLRVEEKVHQMGEGEKAHKQETEEKVHQKNVHKQDAEEKVHQVGLVAEKVQEKVQEKKDTHQDNEPEIKQHQELKEIRDQDKTRGKKDSFTSPPPDKAKPKRLLEERQPMTARFSGTMTARDAGKEVPVTSREVTKELRGEKELAGWEITQKKAFTHWINSYLMTRNLKIEELGNDFRTGVLLIRFLECLTGQAFEQKYHTNPKLKVHSIENSQLSLNYLRNIKVPDITIGPEEIVDGNIKMMLGFCWILLRHFGKQQMQRDRGDKNDNTSFEDSILNWVRDEIKDYNIDISSFKTSFNDGRALLALCHKFKPSCIDYDNTDLSSSYTNVENALRLIEQQYNVPALLHVDDLIAGKESDKNIVLYLSLLHGAWRREMENKKVTEVTEERVVTLQEKLTILEEESRSLKEERSELEEKVEFLKKKLVEESEEKVEMKETKVQESQRIASEKEELRKAKDKLDKEKTDLANENDQILQRLKRQQKAKEELEEAVKKEQAKFGIAMEFLRKNIIEHLQDIEVWKEFLEKDRNFKIESVNLLKEDDLKNKPLEGQIEALNQAILGENKCLEQILEEKEKEKDMEKKKKTPRSPRGMGNSSPRKGKTSHQRIASTSVSVPATKSGGERKSEVKKKT